MSMGSFSGLRSEPKNPRHTVYTFINAQVKRFALKTGIKIGLNRDGMMVRIKMGFPGTNGFLVSNAVTVSNRNPYHDDDGNPSGKPWEHLAHTLEVTHGNLLKEASGRAVMERFKAAINSRFPSLVAKGEGTKLAVIVKAERYVSHLRVNHISEDSFTVQIDLDGITQQDVLDLIPLCIPLWEAPLSH